MKNSNDILTHYVDTPESSDPKPAISITMPAFKAAAFIEETIQSVLNQTFTDFELVIVDDCSPDDTVARIQAFDDSRIKLYQNETNTKLIAKNRNIALSKAQGRYIAFLDADDLLEPHCLETLYSHLQDHPKCTAVYGNFRKIDEDGGMAR